jgi:hypothetical protein
LSPKQGFADMGSRRLLGLAGIALSDRRDDGAMLFGGDARMKQPATTTPPARWAKFGSGKR